MTHINNNLFNDQPVVSPFAAAAAAAAAKPNNWPSSPLPLVRFAVRLRRAAAAAFIIMRSARVLVDGLLNCLSYLVRYLSRPMMTAAAESERLRRAGGKLNSGHCLSIVFGQLRHLNVSHRNRQTLIDAQPLHALATNTCQAHPVGCHRYLRSDYRSAPATRCRLCGSFFQPKQTVPQKHKLKIAIPLGQERGIDLEKRTRAADDTVAISFYTCRLLSHAAQLGSTRALARSLSTCAQYVSDRSLAPTRNLPSR